MRSEWPGVNGASFPQLLGGKEKIFLEKCVELKGLLLLKASPLTDIDNVFVHFSLL